MRQFWKKMRLGMLFSGLVCVVLGLVMLLVDGFLEGALSIVLAAGLSLFGLFEIVFVFARPNGLLSVGRMIPGILSLAVGLVFFFQKDTFFALIWMLMGVALLIDGVYKLQYAFELKAARVGIWWVNLLTSLSALVFAVVLIVRPLDSDGAMTVLSGWLVLANGIFDLVTAGMMAHFSEKLESVTVLEIEDAPREETALAKK